MKTAAAALIALLANQNQYVIWETYTITLADGSVLTYSTRDDVPTLRDNIVLNLSFEDGSGQVIKDGSTYAQTTSAVTANVSNTSPLVQEGSLVITPGTYINYPTTGLFGFGRGPWTWLARIQVAAFVSGNGNCLFDFRTGQFQDGAFFIRGTAPHTAVYWDGSTESSSAGATNIQLGQPVEVACCYDGETVYTFVDGKRIAADVRVIDLGTSNPLRMGANWQNDPDSRSSMKIDEVRIIFGRCLYTEDYVASRGAFPRA